MVCFFSGSSSIHSVGSQESETIKIIKCDVMTKVSNPTAIKGLLIV